MRKVIFSFVVLAFAISGSAKTYYVSTTGSDSNAGTIDAPFASLKSAQEKVVAGDTVYIRGGEYKLTESQIMGYEESGLYACLFDMRTNGTQDKPICYFGYPGERPVFNLTNVKPANKRISVFYLYGSYLHFKNFDIVGTQVTITTHTQSECFSGRHGNYNIIEDIAMHDGMAIGVYFTRGMGNLVLNCDAYNNYDPVSESGQGGNVDGFGCHVPATSTGNVFRGCRAWRNSDDGFDLINNFAAVTFDHCWSFENGYDADMVSRGDGNGFKAGGYGLKAQSAEVAAPRNVIKNCIAYHNKSNGFYANHHLGGDDWLNNSAYLNKYNYSMVNQQSWDVATDVDGYNHTLKNDLSYKGVKGDYTAIDQTKCTLENNTFLPNEMTLTSDDFESLDGTQLTAARKADGSLPDITFLKLVETSSCYANKIGYQFDYDEITGITTPRISSSKTADNSYYTLDGIQTASPQKGLYIHEGKKIAIK